jgi:membrane-anchored mycosin MYCP
MTRALGGAVAVTLSLLPAMPASAAVPTRAAKACGPSFSTPLTDQPWPLRRMRPDRIWPVTRGRNIIVAVIDSGVSDTHPALKGQVLKGYDLITPSGDGRCDNVGHGTLIAGVIAGKQIPGSAFHGIAPAAKILPIRALASSDREFGAEHSVRIADAIRLAVQAKASVINLSLTTAPTPELAEAVRFALDSNVVLVAAAGNIEAVKPPQQGFPAAYEGVIAVGGVDRNGVHVPSSTTGKYLDIAAPGEHIAGPAPQGGGFAEYPEGTSFAAAYVSGVAALVRAYRPELRAEAVARRIIRTVDRTATGWDDRIGNGVLNPYWAVLSVTAEDEEPGPPGQVGLGAPTPDPLRGVRIVAIWAAVAAVGIAAMVVASVSVWRNGRRRGWRPGRPTA